MPEYLSQYLTVDEYTCSHCGQLPPFLRHGEDWRDIPPLVELLESYDLLRGRMGHAIPVRSGWRCDWHNADIGGDRLSVHMFGFALDADFDSAAKANEAWERLEEINRELRLGIYRQTGTFIHLDTGYHIFPKADQNWVKGYRWFR